MRVYRYYRKDAITQEEARLNRYRDDIQSRYPLAGITTSKKIAKGFEKQRNMEMYFKFSDKIIDDDEMVEVTKFMNRHQGVVIDNYELDSIRNRKSSKCEKFTVMLYATRNEIDEVREGSIFIMDPSFWRTTPPADLFNEKYKQSLIALRYDEHRAMMCSGTFSMLNPETGEFIDSDYRVDELATFIKLFGKYLNSDI